MFLSTRDGHCSREQKYNTRCLVRLILSSKLIKYLVAIYHMSVKQALNPKRSPNYSQIN